MYTFTANVVHREIDVFSDGCQLEGGITQFFDYTDLEPVIITGETLMDLLKEIQKYFRVSRESLLLDSCEELGRLDVQTYTKGAKALKCSYRLLEDDFKSGKFNLYLNNISGTVTKTPEDLDLTAILESEVA